MAEPATTTPGRTGGDPSGVGRPVAAGRVETSGQNSGLVVGEVKTTSTTGSDTYKTEFIKVYQDAGVVGISMLTLLVLCVLLGLFCSRLIKMYISLTASRDTLEAARTAAIEKLTTSLVLLRSETNTVITELRRQHDVTTARIDELSASSATYATRSTRAYEMLIEVRDVATAVRQESASDRQAKLERLEELLRGQSRNANPGDRS